jgi:hypothetical protein
MHDPLLRSWDVAPVPWQRRCRDSGHGATGYRRALHDDLLCSERYLSVAYAVGKLVICRASCTLRRTSSKALCALRTRCVSTPVAAPVATVGAAFDRPLASKAFCFPRGLSVTAHKRRTRSRHTRVWQRFSSRLGCRCRLCRHVRIWEQWPGGIFTHAVRSAAGAPRVVRQPSRAKAKCLSAAATPAKVNY